jgi:uncharacterized membrane protein
MTEAPRAERLVGLDRLRGLVIVIMALDHARDYFSVFPYSATDLSKASVALFLTRWITHFCAPVFVFLAGTSAYLHARNGGLTRPQLSRFLITRGLWLVFLELTWNNFMWRFNLHGIQLQVLWALGWSMVVLAGAIWLPRAALVALGVVIVAGHNLLDGIHADDLGPTGSAPWLAWIVLHQPHFGKTDSGFELGLLYPLIPWVAVMLLGYAFGTVVQRPRAARERTMIVAGFAMLALFLALRLNNFYGNPDVTAFGEHQYWATNVRGLAYTALGVLNVDKYPPSLLYLLMTLGPALLLLPSIEAWRGRLAEIFATFGRVPMFFYLLHVPLLHGASLIAVTLMFGADATARLGPKGGNVLPGYEPSLMPVYLAWLAVVAALYPACRWYAGYKQRHREQWWLSYL